MTRIVVDAMGSDAYPTPDIVGAVMAAREYGVEIILVGENPRATPWHRPLSMCETGQRVAEEARDPPQVAILK